MARCRHMAGPRKPTWMPTWCLRGVHSDIKQSGFNRATGRLKSHGVESASWATIPPITSDPTAEITRSEIRVTSHQFRAIQPLKSHGVKSASWPRSTNFAQTSL